jgi:hypothetical protein
MWYVSGRREVHTEFWREKLKETYHSGDLDVDGWIISKYILKI